MSNAAVRYEPQPAVHEEVILFVLAGTRGGPERGSVLGPLGSDPDPEPRFQGLSTSTCPNHLSSLQSGPPCSPTSKQPVHHLHGG